MRQTIGKETDLNYAIDVNKKLISNNIQRIAERIDDEKNGIQRYPNPNLEIIKNKYNSLFDHTRDLLIAKYSQGNNIEEIVPLYLEALQYMDNSWGKQSPAEFTYGGDTTPYFSFDQYWDVITMLSLGVLLEVSSEEFIKLVNIREKVEEKDFLLDTIISYCLKDYEVTNHIMETNPYQELVKVISTSKSDKDKAVDMLKTYLSKKWYKDNVEMFWYNYHKESKLHFGYWSFESGALVKILGLDDSILKEQQYYPYDMVHFKD